MRITKISLTNFRSFKDTQTIDLAPVTLLFGPNSVGKSSVLMALAYVQQILQKGHCDPQQLDALGKKSIGGFSSLVHAQDLSKTITIKFDYENSGLPPNSYDSKAEEIGNELGLSYLKMPDYDGSLNNGAVAFDISWSNEFNRAFVEKVTYWANGTFIACVASSEDLKRTEIQDLNLNHMLLQTLDDTEWTQREYGYEPDGRVIPDDEWVSELEQVLYELNPSKAPKNHIAAPISLKCRFGALPLLDRPVLTNLQGQDFENIEEHLNYQVLESLLSQIVVTPLDRLLKLLSESIQIGPLRLVPDNDYVPNPHPEQKGWVDGSAAWDLLYKDPNADDIIKKLLKDTSDWFSSSDKLDAGYEVINQSIAELSSSGRDNELVGLLRKRHLFFKELRTNILLSANQLGTGISQVLPIVVAANHDKIGLVCVEQPELHIHPRFQVELADIFLRAKDKHSFLIETHSEHLILRILKRIRQTTENELPDNYKAIQEGDVSIVYLEPTENGVVTKRIRVDEDGEIIDRWPHGFFIERAEELF